jgi:hypothetical protein
MRGAGSVGLIIQYFVVAIFLKPRAPITHWPRAPISLSVIQIFRYFNNFEAVRILGGRGQAFDWFGLNILRRSRQCHNEFICLGPRKI